MPKRFCVDNQSDPKSVARAITDLKRMAHLGDRAKKILEALETNGHFDGRMPVLTLDRGLYRVETRRYPAFEPISRDDIPGWYNLTVECGELKESKYGGSKFWAMPVYLNGTALMMGRDSDGTYKGKVLKVTMKCRFDRARLGECRLKSNGTVTFEAASNYRWGISGVFRIKRDPDASDKTREEANIFARMVAQCLVNYGEVNYYGGPIIREIPQKMLDLQAEVPKWLIEDGLVKRMFNDILDVIEVVKVQAC